MVCVLHVACDIHSVHRIGIPCRLHSRADRGNKPDMPACPPEGMKFATVNTCVACSLCMCSLQCFACGAGYTAEQAEDMFASVDKDGNGVIVEDEFIKWCQEELQRAADAAVEENEHFMSDSESDEDDDELVSKHAVMGAADEAAFAKRLGIDARQLSLGLYT